MGAGSKARIEALEDTWHWGPTAQATYEEVLTGPDQNVARMLKAMVEGLGHNGHSRSLAGLAGLREGRLLRPAPGPASFCAPGRLRLHFPVDLHWRWRLMHKGDSRHSQVRHERV